MPNLTASIPHRLGREEAKRRIEHQFGELRRHSGGMLADLKESWSGDRMDFTFLAMGQAIVGHLTVDNEVIHLDVTLPWLLSMIAGAVMQSIRQQVHRSLSGPSGESSV